MSGVQARPAGSGQQPISSRPLGNQANLPPGGFNQPQPKQHWVYFGDYGRAGVVNAILLCALAFFLGARFKPDSPDPYAKALYEEMRYQSDFMAREYWLKLLKDGFSEKCCDAILATQFPPRPEYYSSVDSPAQPRTTLSIGAFPVAGLICTCVVAAIIIAMSRGRRNRSPAASRSAHLPVTAPTQTSNETSQQTSVPPPATDRASTYESMQVVWCCCRCEKWDNYHTAPQCLLCEHYACESCKTTTWSRYIGEVFDQDCRSRLEWRSRLNL